MDFSFITQDGPVFVQNCQLRVIRDFANVLHHNFREELSNTHLPSLSTIHPSGSDGREHNDATIWLIGKAMLEASLLRYAQNGPEAEGFKSILETPMTVETRDFGNRMIRMLHDFMVEDMTKERNTRPDGEDSNMCDEMQPDKVITDVGVILCVLLGRANADIPDDILMGNS